MSYTLLVSISLTTYSILLTHVLYLGACQVGSGLFGQWFWLLYLVVSDVVLCVNENVESAVRSLLLRVTNFGVQ